MPREGLPINLEGEAKKQKIAIVDISGAVEKETRDVAEAKLTAEEKDVKGLGGFLKKIWKYNLFREYYRQKEIGLAKKKILTEKNLYAGEEGAKADHEKAMAAVTERFLSEREEMLHQEAGEAKEVLGQEADAVNFRNELKRLIKEFAAGSLEEGAFIEEKNCLISSYAGHRPEMLGGGQMYADNLLEIARNIKNNFQDNQGLNNLDLDFEITIGRAKAGVRSEANFNRVDRITKKLQETWLGRYLNEATIATGVALASCAAKRVVSAGTGRILSWISMGATGLVAGGVAAARESVMIEEEKRLHAREMAKGKTVEMYWSEKKPHLNAAIKGLESRGLLTKDEARDLMQKMKKAKNKEEAMRVAESLPAGQAKEILQQELAKTEMGKRRAELEKFRHQFVKAGDLSANLNDGLYEIEENTGKKMEKEITSPEQFNSVLIQLAEIEARIKLSDTQNIDLIGYSDGRLVEQERLKLDLDRAQAKVLLKQTLEKNSGLKVDGLPYSRDPEYLKKHLEQLTNLKVTELSGGDQGIERKNELFKKFKRGRVLKAALTGAGMGLVIGAGIQEAAYEIKDWLGWNQPNVETPIRALVKWLKGTLPQEQIIPGTPTLMPVQEVFLPGTDTPITLPSSLEIVPAPGGGYQFMGADGHLIGDEFLPNPDGSLPAESRFALESAGFCLNEQNQTLVDGHTETIKEGIKDWVREHLEGMHKIKRDLWYANDTPMYRDLVTGKLLGADLNELKLWWGGQGNTGLDSQGNYIFDAKHMMPEGSWETIGGVKHSANPLELMKEGKLTTLLTLSRGTQNYAFEMPVSPTGQVLIDKNSEIGHLLFSVENGHAKFLGNAVEVAQTMGADKSGAEHFRVVATHMGEGLKDSWQNIEVADFNEGVATEIADWGQAPSILKPEYQIIPPDFLPIWGRRPLEKAKNPLDLPPVYINPYYYEGENLDPNESRENQDVLSSTLKENPEAKLDFAFEAERHFASFPPEKMAEIKDLNGQIGKEMERDCKLAVCIPCASHLEAKNIYHTLKLYSEQKDDKDRPLDPKNFEIILFLNRPKGANSDGTESEVKRFQKDYPQLKLRVIEKITDWGEISSWEETVNLNSVCRRIYDVATLRSLVSESRKKLKEKDIAILMADADCSEISGQLVNDYIQFFGADKDKRIDAIVGDVHWDKKILNLPTFFALWHFWHGMEKQSFINPDQPNKPSWGANFAIRASSLCAIGGRRDRPEPNSDLRIGRALLEARRPKGGKFKYGSPIRYDYQAWLDSSPRRVLKQYLWRRGQKVMDEQLERILATEQSVDTLNVKEVEAAINVMLMPLHLDLREPAKAPGQKIKKFREQCRAMFDKVANHMGIGYKIVDRTGKITITSMEIFKQKLSRARKGEIFFESLPGGNQKGRLKSK